MIPVQSRKTKVISSTNSTLKLATMVVQTPAPALATRLPADCCADVIQAVSDDSQLVATADPVHSPVIVSNSGEKVQTAKSCPHDVMIIQFESIAIDMTLGILSILQYTAVSKCHVQSEAKSRRRHPHNFQRA